MIGPTNANPKNTVMTPAASITVGSDIRPIKIVNGVATAVANDLATDSAVVHLAGTETITGLKTVSINNEAKMLLKDSRMDVTSTSISSNTWSSLQFVDADNKRVAQVSAYQRNAYRHIELYAFRTSSAYKALKLIMNASDDSGYMTIPYRTYSASNTDDAVTIGSLQASTDVVHTSGNETVGGVKLISGSLNIGVTSGMIFKDNFSTGTLPSSNTYRDILYRSTSGSTNHGYITFGTNSSGTGSISLGIRDYNGSNESHLNMYSGPNGYITAPYRTSNITNDDVLTAGNGVTLGTAQEISGAKTFTSDPYLSKADMNRFKCKATGIVKGTLYDAEKSAGGFIALNNDDDVLMGLTHRQSTTGTGS